MNILIVLLTKYDFLIGRAINRLISLPKTFTPIYLQLIESRTMPAPSGSTHVVVCSESVVTEYLCEFQL